MNPNTLDPSESRPGQAAKRGNTPFPADHGAFRQRLIRFAGAAVAILICFAKPVIDLFRFSLSNDLFSFIPLIPVVSAYLVWVMRRTIPIDSKPSPGAALLPFSAGLGLVAAYWLGRQSGWTPAESDYLALMTLSLLLLLLAGAFFYLGAGTLRAVAFPAGFLLFMVPFPAQLHDGIESFLQNASADTAYLFFLAAGTPVFFEGTSFQLPGFAVEVAPECSGINSTYMLFITSIVASYFFLRRPWSRAVLVLFVIPLALLRNGFRILVIGELCVHISPLMINSYIHRKGGPIFFALSLIPFFLLLLFLQRLENRREARAAAQKPASA